LEKLGVPLKSSKKRPIRKPAKSSPQRYTPNSQAQRKFDLDVMAFLVNSNLHYSFVETKGFQHFVSVTNQKYNVKSSRTMSKQIAPLLHKKLNKAMHEVLQKELPECHNVAFTYNTWDRLQIRDEEEEEANTECLLSLSIHYINKHFEFRKIAFSVDLGVYPSEDDIATAVDERTSSITCTNDN
jgi:hypothetical protein